MKKERANEVITWLASLLEHDKKPLSVALIKKAIQKVEHGSKENEWYVELDTEGNYIGFATLTKFALDYSIDTFYIIEVERGKGHGSRLMEQLLVDYHDKELFIQSMSFPMDYILLKNDFFLMDDSAEELWVKMPRK